MLYEYECKVCGNQTESVNRMADRHTGAPSCCDQQMNLYIGTPPMGYVDRSIFYRCPVTGEGVTSKKQRREIMAREGLVSAHELCRSKEQRQKEVNEKKAIVEKGFGPKEVQKQVDGWAKRQVGLA